MITAVLITGMGALIGLAIWGKTNKKKSRLSAYQLKKIRTHWSDIETKMKEKKWREAVLDADILLDQVLTMKKLSGDLGSKLKKSGYLFSDINGVWEAHKCRNRLVHELDSKITATEAKKMISRFKQALNDLSVF